MRDAGTTRTICVDASFTLPLVLPHPERQRVRDQWQEWLQSDRRIVAPRLWVWEVSNALWRATKFSTSPLPRPKGLADLRSLLALPVELQEVEPHAGAVWEDVLEPFDLASAYDGCYLITAILEEAEFWTCDRQLAERVGAVDWIKRVP
mgnify:CR=1 FL=1